MRTAGVHNGTYGLTESAMAAVSSLESLTLTDCCAGRRVSLVVLLSSAKNWHCGLKFSLMAD
jgi:hypothetical protein